MLRVSSYYGNQIQRVRPATWPGQSVGVDTTPYLLPFTPGHRRRRYAQGITEPTPCHAFSARGNVKRA